MGHTITIRTEGGGYSAYVASPAETPAPAVVVLHEVFGLNEDIRHTCRELAAAGFLAIAPELFWRQERGVDLNSWSEEEWTKGLALYSGFDRDLGVRDILATARAARQLPGASGKVGLMGFCLGGLMAYLTVARQDVDAAVAYHGADTERYLDEAYAITAPLLMHLAGEDEFMGKEAQQRIHTALGNMPNIAIHTYPGQRYASARHTGTHYDAEAAATASARPRAFLTEHLSS